MEINRGFFDTIFKGNKTPDNKQQTDEIVISSSSRTVTDIEYADDEKKYSISFKLNEAFKEAKSHSDIEMLYTYSPNGEYGKEGDFPYFAIQYDDEVYCAVAEFKENGSFEGAIELTPLSGQFFFKAKMKYFDYMMYFYGIDRCDGFWENNGLCIVYPKALTGTESEKRLMSVLDEAAQSYCETLNK